MDLMYNKGTSSKQSKVNLRHNNLVSLNPRCHHQAAGQQRKWRAYPSDHCIQLLETPNKRYSRKHGNYSNKRQCHGQGDCTHSLLEAIRRIYWSISAKHRSANYRNYQEMSSPRALRQAIQHLSDALKVEHPRTMEHQ